MVVDRIKNVLVVMVLRSRTMVTSGSREAMITVTDLPEYESDSGVQCGILMHFHRRLGHLCFDTIINEANDLASCIKQKYTTHMNCLSCT